MPSTKMTPFQELTDKLVKSLGLDPEEAESVARKMRRLGFKAVRLAEAACNRELTPAEEREDARLDAAFKALCESIGAKANMSGDPRGYVYHVVLPPFPGAEPGKVAQRDGHNWHPPYNTWGGAEHGWGVTQR